MKGNQITIKDIARQLGISPSTVSRALKDHPDISPKTIEAVKKLAEELNYQPNSIALSLRQQKSNTIGVIIPEIVHFFFSTVISGIEDVAYEAGYSVIVSQSNESYEREVMDSKALFNNRVDGMLVSVSRETTNFDHLSSIKNRGMPIVCFDRICEPLNCSQVIVDDFDGAFKATEHLVRQGYKKIAYLGGPLNLSTHRLRLDGYKAALKKYDIILNDAHVLTDHASDDDHNAKEILAMLLDSPNPPDAVFAISDILALGAMFAVKERNINIPKDFGVIGFSNWRFTELTEPSMSTIDQPGFAMGQEAARLLIKEIQSEDESNIEPEIITLKTNLIKRNSTTPRN